MKTKFTQAFGFLPLIVLFFISVALQAQQFKAVNDTIYLAPGFSATVDIMANDFFPPGDTIKIIGGTGNGYVQSTHNGSVYTYTANPQGNLWGVANVQYGNYALFDVSTDSVSPALLVFMIRDHANDSLYLNNVNALFSSRGSHFYGRNAGRFEVPKFSGKSTLFLNTLWVGGLDSDSVLHLAAQRYGQGPNTGTAGTNNDFFAGPIMDSNAYSAVQDTLWNRMWNLKKSDIEYHKAHYNQAGYVPIPDIMSWPGNGNVALGQAHELAPFFDVNGDQQYNPLEGDYPLIRGDQALFFIFNDARNYHSESQGNNLKIEIHGLAYVFDLPNDSAFKNTVFLNYKIINRSDKIYHKTFIGTFTDPDIGYAQDDYIGCDVERSSYYGYNGKPIDGSGQPGSYGDHPPAQSITILGGPLLPPDGIDNPRFDNSGHQLCNESVNGVGFGDGIVDNERYGMRKFVYFNNSNSGVPVYMTDPNYAPDYYKYMQGIWKDDSVMVYGGNGHYSAGAYGPKCNFMFPGMSDSLNWGVGCQPPNGPVNWTEKTAQNNPQDRRGLASIGPFTFNPGELLELDLAFTFARDYTGNDSLSSVPKLMSMIDIIRNSFITNTLPNGQSFNAISENAANEQLPVTIYPNPAGMFVNVEMSSGVKEKASGRMLNSSGNVVYSFQVNPGSTVKLDVSGMASGLYLMEIRTDDQSVTKKLSIVR
jgi:hypothetical protein